MRRPGACGSRFSLVKRGLVLRVTDDGRGLDRWGASGGGGVRGMRERAALIGATLTVGRQPKEERRYGSKCPPQGTST